MDAAAAPEKGEVTREQLLEFIKKLKIKLKRVEKEAETHALENEKLQVVVQQQQQQQQQGGSSLAMGNEPCLFWEMIGREAPFMQNLARAALRAILGRPLTRKVSVHSAFERWKACAAQIKLGEMVKNVAILEQRCAKLKGLLSRTHQASKQQAEDTNAFKRAQRETTQELRTHAQEKLALIEEVRARDIEFAFHQDLELYIQKAAEGVMSQHQQLQLQLQTQSQGTVSKSVLKDMEDEMAKLVKMMQEAQTRETELNAKLRESRQQAAKAEKAGALLQDKSRQLEDRHRVVEKQLVDEASARRDLEVELDITLRNRADILREVELGAETRLSRYMQESKGQVDNLTEQCAQAEKRLEVALASAAAATEENTKLRSLAQLNDNTNELATLRVRVSEYKKLVKSGNVLTLQGGQQTLTQILDLADYFAKQARLSSDELKSKTATGRTLLRHVVKLYSGILKAAAARLSPYVPPGTGQAGHPAGPDPAEVATLQFFDPSLLSSAYVQQQVLQDNIKNLEAQLAKLHQSSDEPMVWEASSVTIQAGRDITFAIPMRAETANSGSSSSSMTKAGNNATLEWSYTGAQASFVSLTLGKAQGRPLDALSLQSVQGHGAKSQEYKGMHHVSSLDGDRVLKLSTSSMWGPVTLSYFIRLTFEKSDEAFLQRRQLGAALDGEMRALGVLTGRIDGAKEPLGKFSILVTKASAISDNAADDADESCAERIERIRAESHRFESLRGIALKSIKKAAEPRQVSPLVFQSSLKKTQDAAGSGSGSGNQRVFVADAGALSVLNCESLCIRASDDFRVYIPPSLMQRPFKLQWTLELISKNNADIGFTILEQQEDGALPTIIPYRRVKAETSGEILLSGRDNTIIILLDNSFSWTRAKELKCSIQIVQAETDDGGAGDQQSLDSEEISPAKRLTYNHVQSLDQVLLQDDDLLSALCLFL